MPYFVSSSRVELQIIAYFMGWNIFSKCGIDHFLNKLQIYCWTVFYIGKMLYWMYVRISRILSGLLENNIVFHFTIWNKILVAWLNMLRILQVFSFVEIYSHSKSNPVLVSVLSELNLIKPRPSGKVRLGGIVVRQNL